MLFSIQINTVKGNTFCKKKYLKHSHVAIFHVMPQKNQSEIFPSYVCNYISESSPAVEDEPPLSQEFV